MHTLGYVSSVSPQDMEHDDDPLMSLLGAHRQAHRKTSSTRRSALAVREPPRRSRSTPMAVSSPANSVRTRAAPGEDCLSHARPPGSGVGRSRSWKARKRCHVVVMDVNNGDVIALSSTPGFDPNWFNVGLSGAQWHDWPPMICKPLLNKVTSAIYPPGSPFKTAVALAAARKLASPPRNITSAVMACTISGGTLSLLAAQRPWHAGRDRRLRHGCDVFFYGDRTPRRYRVPLRLRRRSWAWVRSPASDFPANISA